MVWAEQILKMRSEKATDETTTEHLEKVNGFFQVIDMFSYCCSFIPTFIYLFGISPRISQLQIENIML